MISGKPPPVKNQSRPAGAGRHPAADSGKFGRRQILAAAVLSPNAPAFRLSSWINEGEFASLREAVDVLLVGTGGELPVDPRHAALLARRLLEYKVSAVVDLYEFKLPERRR